MADMPGTRLPRLLALLACLATLSGCGEEAPIRIGFVGSLSGRGADIGESSRKAVQLAIEARNAQGGIDGRAIELLVRDDRTSAEGGAQAARELADASVIMRNPLASKPYRSSIARNACASATQLGRLLRGSP